MSGDPRRRPSQLPRRAFLEVLAAAPCALAGCATPGKPPPAAAGAPRAAGDGGEGAGAGEDAAVAAVRSVALPREAEPACVFRAAGARPGALR